MDVAGEAPQDGPTTYEVPSLFNTAREWLISHIDLVTKLGDLPDDISQYIREQVFIRACLVPGAAPPSPASRLHATEGMLRVFTGRAFTVPELDLSDYGMHVTDTWMTTIALLNGLRDLNLQDCLELSNTGFQLLTSMRELERLGLRRCCTFSKTSALRQLTHLRYLDLTSTHITDDQVEDLLCLKSLEELLLGNTKVSFRTIAPAASPSATLPSLRKLDLSRTKVSSHGLTKIVTYFPNLLALDIGNCRELYAQTGPPGVPDVCAGLQGLSKLQSLHLSGLFRAPPTGLHRYLSSTGRGQLTELDLSYNPGVDDSTIDLLLGSSGPAGPNAAEYTIQDLDLSYTKITDTIILRQVFNAMPLRSLNIANTNVSTNSLKFLSRQANIRNTLVCLVFGRKDTSIPTPSLLSALFPKQDMVAIERVVLNGTCGDGSTAEDYEKTLGYAIEFTNS